MTNGKTLTVDDPEFRRLWLAGTVDWILRDWMDGDLDLEIPGSEISSLADHGAMMLESAIANAGFALVKVPVLPHPGGSTQSQHWHEAAGRIEKGYEAGGSTMKDVTAQLLRSIARAIEE